jgi:2-oxoisovalerate dehydrogenase E1 component
VTVTVPEDRPEIAQLLGAVELDRDLGLGLLRRMALIRDFEQTAYLRFLQGEIPGTLHQSQGQEAVAVGVCSLLRADDWITSTHRPHGHALAKGMPATVALAEIYGKRPGCVAGRGGSMHIGDPELGIFPPTAIVGGGLTLAPGMALALSRQGSDSVVVCFFGDGATNEGAFHEGINFAAIKQLPVVFVCENNGYGASTPFAETTKNTDIASKAQAYGIPSERVDGMDVLAVREAAARAISRARRGDGPTLVECLTYRYVGHSRGDARGYRTKDEEAEWKARDPIPRLRAHLVATGLATEDDTAAALAWAKDEMRDALKFAQEAPAPEPHEALDLAQVYGNPPSGGPIEPPLEAGPDDRMLSIADALKEGIRDELAANPALLLLGEDVGVPGGFGGAFGVYLGLAEEFGRDRVIDTPIAEKALMGVSIGAAALGVPTLPDLQYADFVFEAMDELVNQAAKLRYLSAGKLTIPTVLRCPVGAAERGAQHSQVPDSMFLNVPGLKVLCISDAYTAKGGIKAALRDPDPVLVFEHKKLYGSKTRREAGSTDTRAYVPLDDYVVPVGRARVRRHGTDVTVLATFLQLYQALEIAADLEAEGISCEVIDPVWIAPFDWDNVFASVRKTRRLVIAHEAHLTGGWGAEVAARVGTELFGVLASPIQRIATADVPIPVPPVLEAVVLPSKEALREAIVNSVRS